MKKNLSVLALVERASLYKLLILLAAMAGTEFLLFRKALSEALREAAATNGSYMISLESVISRSHISRVYAVSFVLLALLLLLFGCAFGSNPGYTLRRLSVSEGRVAAWQSVWNGISLFLLWAVQVLLSFLFCRMYCAEAGAAYVSNQTIFLAYYRSPFLHSLLPLSTISGWVRNIFILMAFSMAAACFPYCQRRGKRSYNIAVVVVLTLIFFTKRLSEHDMYVGLAFVMLVIMFITRLHMSGGDKDEEI